jgi:hypothetical protein
LISIVAPSESPGQIWKQASQMLERRSTTSDVQPDGARSSLAQLPPSIVIAQVLKLDYNAFTWFVCLPVFAGPAGRVVKVA